MAGQALTGVLTDPKVIAELGKVSIKFLDMIAKQLSENQTRFKMLLQKADENALRAFLAGIQALGDAITTQRADSRERLLTFAESNLYESSKLDARLITNGRTNSYWIAQSHYGLAVLFALRQDDIMAATHTLRVMAADPRLGRTELVPGLYSAIFEPACAAVQEWHDAEAKKLMAKSFAGDVALAKVTAGGVGAVGATGVIATLFFSGGKVPVSGAAKSVSDQVEKMWNEATPEHFRGKALNELKVEFERRIDDRCRALAEEAIARIQTHSARVGLLAVAAAAPPHPFVAFSSPASASASPVEWSTPPLVEGSPLPVVTRTNTTGRSSKAQARVKKAPAERSTRPARSTQRQRRTRSE